MQPVLKDDPPRRRRMYVVRWALPIGARFAGGTVVARSASAMGRQIYSTAFACGAIRHLLFPVNHLFTLTKN